MVARTIIENNRSKEKMRNKFKIGGTWYSDNCITDTLHDRRIVKELEFSTSPMIEEKKEGGVIEIPRAAK